MGRDLLVLNILCPSCDAPLTEGSKIVLDIYSPGSQKGGTIKLSAVFGDYDVETDVHVEDGEMVEFRCPHCESELQLNTPCELCGASMASMHIKEGGSILFCTRKGCKNHSLGGIKDIDEMMRIMNNVMDTPFD